MIQTEADGEASDAANQDDRELAAEDGAQNVRWRRPEREANAELPPPTRHAVRSYS